MIKRVRKIRKAKRARPSAVDLRAVPPHIVKPTYATKGRLGARGASCVKSAEELARMRVACAAAREVLETVLSAVRPGITTEELEVIAHDAALARGAYPSPLGYPGGRAVPPFPKSLCTSVNDVVCHGIPEDRTLKDGDLINCDVTVYLDGMHGDCSETVFVGQPSAEARRLVEVTYDCLQAGIAAAQPGAPLNAIGKAISALAGEAGFSVVRDFTGHGIGAQFHMSPQILHYFDARATTRLTAGMTFTVEPMINLGAAACVILDDGWTAITRDGKLSAQFEHTIHLTEDGAEVLTGPGVVPFFLR